MGVEHCPILIVAWIDSEGRNALIETLVCLYNECHIDHSHISHLNEADANHFLGLMKRYGTIVPNQVPGRLPK